MLEAQFRTRFGADPWNKGLNKESDPRVKAPNTAFKKENVPWNSRNKEED